MNDLRVVIVEDEKIAAANLAKMIAGTDASLKIVAMLSSVQQAVAWFAENRADLIFMDIQLGDGQSFRIFELATVESPVIFTTAYDQYAIKAFKANGIAYLLKPIDQTELKQAIDRYRKFNQQAPDLAALHEMLAKLGKPPEYKQRFMVQAGSRIKSVPVTDIAYFYFLERDVFFCTTHDKHYPSEYSLERLEELTDPVNFFRINRRMLVSFTAIDSIFSLSRSRIKLELKPAFDGDVLVSFNKTPKFREWLDR